MEIPNITDLNASKIQERYIRIHYPDFYNYLKESYPNLSHTERLYWYYHDIKEFPKCHCGNPVKFLSFGRGYQKCCSNKCVSTDQDIIRMKEETSIKNHGTKYPMQCTHIRNKSKQTCLEKYGVENPFSSENVKKKIKQTCLKKYGVEHHLQNHTIKGKLISTMRNFNVDNDDNLIGYTDDGYQIRKCPHHNCNKCKDKTYIISCGLYHDRLRIGAELCTKLLKIGSKHNSTLERKIIELLENHNIRYIRNSRKLMGDHKEIDIYIPDINLGIECNGIWTHSSINNKDNKPSNYHVMKTKKCQENNITLIHLWEDWFIYKWDILKSILLNKLNLTPIKLYARKCIIKLVDKKDCDEFLNQNHIQGAPPQSNKSTIMIGLYYDNNLVSIMTFSKPRANIGGKNHKQQWELVRFCNKINCNVIGGASKLFKYFIKEYNPESIVSFSMNDISCGNLYKLLGFKSNMKTSNSYWYFEPKTFKRFHRSSFTKNNIVKKWKWRDENDGSWTENEVMTEKGYFKIYDSGQLKWVWEKKTDN